MRLKRGTPLRWAFGDATHWFAGALMGIAVALIFKYFGSDYAYFKGIGFGITMWIVHVIVIPNMVQPRPYLFRTEMEALVDFAAHLAYGVLTTFYLLRVYKRSLT